MNCSFKITSKMLLMATIEFSYSEILLIVIVSCNISELKKYYNHNPFNNPLFTF